MAKSKNPLFSFSAAGSLARRLTFRRTRQATVAESFPTHKDAGTPSQLSWRTMYEACSALWHTLSDIEKQAWEANARPKHMTGFALWQSQCLRPNPGIYLPLAGGTMQGDINMATKSITNLPAPATNDEPARKTDLATHLSADIHTQAQTPTAHGNEYHDPDFASEAALSSHAAAATGVHGVGSNYIAKSSVDGLNLASHKSRHAYLGADELPILYLIAQRAIPMINKHWGDLGGFTEAHSGGSFFTGINYGKLWSGSTADNYGRIYPSPAFWHHYPSSGYTLGIKISIRQAANQDMWLGWFASTTPGTNQNHYAFRILDNSLYAYAGKDDINKENSNALATWADKADFFLSMRDSKDAIEFYVNHALVYSVTNPANRPVSAELYLVFYLKTTEAVLKQCFLLPFTLFPAHAH